MKDDKVRVFFDKFISGFSIDLLLISRKLENLKLLRLLCDVKLQLPAYVVRLGFEWDEEKTREIIQHFLATRSVKFNDLKDLLLTAIMKSKNGSTGDFEKAMVSMFGSNRAIAYFAEIQWQH